MPHAWAARGFVAVVAAYSLLEHFLAAWLSEHHWSSDFAQHVWWTERFANPALFPNDFIADFFSLPVFVPWGYQAWMRVAVPVVGAQSAAEALALPLGIALVWLGWRLGRAGSGGSLAGGVAGGLAGAFLLSTIDGGLPRDFGLPLLGLGMLGLLEARLWVVGLAGLLAALFYPPVAVSLGLTAGVTLGLDVVRERRLPAGWPALAAFGVAALAVVLSVYATPLPEDVGPKLTGAEARAMAEFGPDGRSRMFFPSTLETYFGRGRGGYGLDWRVSLGLAIAIAISAWRMRGLVPRAAWALIGTGVLAHGVAHATLFLLHLPERYVTRALPIFLVIWLAALAARGFDAGVARWPALGQPRTLLAVGGLFLAVDGGLGIREAVASVNEPNYLARLEMLGFLETLPEDTLIVAHPDDANAIPLRTKRSVLASKEVALPYYRGYYERVSERLEASLRAHYARKWETVDRLYELYGADVIVVHDHRYKKKHRSFSEPFESRLGKQLLAKRKKYVLVRPPSDRLLFHHGAFWVVRLGPPRAGYPVREGWNPLIEAKPAAAGTR